MKHFPFLAALVLLCSGLVLADTTIDLSTLSGEYVINDSGTYEIVSGSVDLQGWITVKSGSPVLKIGGGETGVGASCETYGKILVIESTDPVVIDLGESNFTFLEVKSGSATDYYPPICLCDGADVTITGNGVLQVRSSVDGCACIGSAPNSDANYRLTIAGGDISVDPPHDAAGIGGSQGAHCNVKITGGFISPFMSASHLYGCTIGCGKDGYLDAVEIAGGILICASQDSVGIGCIGENQAEDGYIKVSDGLLEAAALGSCGDAIGAEAGNQPRIEFDGGYIVVEGDCATAPVNQSDALVYSVMMEGILEGAKVPVSLTVKKGGMDYPYVFNCDNPMIEEVGSAVFYLPTGNYVVNGGAQQYGGTVEAHDMNVFTVVPEPACCLLALLGLALLRRK